MDDGKQAMSAYCKSQLEINKVDTRSVERRKELNERIRTFRSILTDELGNRNMSCVELYPPGDSTVDPVYVRLKPPASQPNYDPEKIVSILRVVNTTELNQIADKHNNDLPRMLIALLNAKMRDGVAPPSDRQHTLHISNCKERGFERERQNSLPQDVMQMANDLLHARSELINLKQQDVSAKQTMVDDQRRVETIVKESLKQSDPQNMTARVHMLQEGNEWVYYLRCKEKEMRPTVGVRRVIPIVERALTMALERQGLGREYHSALEMNSQFWDDVNSFVHTGITELRAEVKTKSKISLDRGAPRKQRRRDPEAVGAEQDAK